MTEVNNDTLWNLYKKKKRDLLYYGLTNGLVKQYDEELLSKLREVYYGGIPSSIILLCRKMCARFCYDRAVLLAHAFKDDDYKLVYAHIDAIALNPKQQEKIKKDKRTSIHCFVERTLKNGEVFVYDTTLGLAIEKDLYYKIENPIVTHINSKEKTINFFEYEETENRDDNEDKYSPLLLLPKIEASLKESRYINDELLKEEIEMFKEIIDYDALEIEFNEMIKEYKEMEENGLYKMILERKK